MIAILRDTEAIGKDSVNQSQGFKFRGIDAVIQSLHAIFQKHGVFICPEVLEHNWIEQTTKSGGMQIHLWTKTRFHFYAEDGSSVTMTGLGEAADSGDKATAKTLSISLKYCLSHALLIPTQDDSDPDAHTPPGASGKARRGTVLAGSKLTPEQQAVLDAKLTQQKLERERAQAQQPPAPPPAKPASGTPVFDALKHFGDMKKKIGDSDYYRILGNNGYEKSNEITDRETARRIYLQMAEFSKEQAAAKEPQTV
jgi:hypothetical protein